MFIITAKVPRPHPAFGVAIAALLCCAALVLTLTPPSAQTAAQSPVPGLNRHHWDVQGPPTPRSRGQTLLQPATQEPAS